MMLTKTMASVEIPFGTIPELSARLAQLADDVLTSDPSTREGQDARRLYRVAVRQLEMKAKITGDPLLSALL